MLGADPEPEAPGGGRRRALFLAASVLVTTALAGVAFWLGSWGFDYRRDSLHNGRLRRLLERKPRMDQVVEALRDEGSPLVASPEGDAALRAEAVGRGRTKAAEVLEKGRRFRHTRVFLAADMVYFIFFGDDGVMGDFTCVSR
jgi:hypothetical protein